jgi:WD40 repeat protein
LQLKSRILSSSNDNAKFASSGGDRSVFVWDVASGTTTRRLAGHMGKIHVVEFNEDASVVASGKLLNLLFVGLRNQSTPARIL